jgi:hypothetical protein
VLWMGDSSGHHLRSDLQPIAAARSHWLVCHPHHGCLELIAA